MIVHLTPDIRDAVDDVALARIVATPLYEQTTCAICAQTLPAGEDGQASAIVLRAPDGTVHARYAHRDCSESKLLDVDELPAAASAAPTPTPPDTIPPPAPSTPPDAAVAWALVGRKGRVPNVALIWDLEASGAFADRPHHTLRLLQDHGLRPPTRTILNLDPKLTDTCLLTRDEQTLILRTPAGTDELRMEDPQTSIPMLEIAAAQGRILLVAGAGLELVHNDLVLTDQQLRADGACAQIPYEDEDLKPRPSRAQRLLGRVLGTPRTPGAAKP